MISDASLILAKISAHVKFSINRDKNNFTVKIKDIPKSVINNRQEWIDVVIYS